MIKKNITINFSGRLYAIDEDACELLSHYTDTLRRYFKNEGTEEVADDIETRIAELFDEQVAQGANAINLQMVEAIIRQIGQLSELAPGAENAGYSETKTQEKSAASAPNKPRKRLYRDLEHNVIAGVCAGLSNYTSIPAGIWRFGFVLFLLSPLLVSFIPFVGLFVFAFSLLLNPLVIYILAAIIMPAAETPEDRLRMRGVEVNPQNLSDEVARKPQIGNKNIFISFFSMLYRIIAFLLGSMAGIGLLAAVICFFYYWDDNLRVAGMPILIANQGAMWDAVREQTRVDAVVFSICFVSVFLAFVYCCFHAVTKGYGRRCSMTWRQRLMWIGAIILFIAGCFISANSGAQKTKRIRDHYRQMEREANMHDGYYFSDKEWDFFQKGNWTLIRAENLTDDRYTYAGEYPDGDPDERYLDAYSSSRNLIYRVERTDSVAAGNYRLYSLARCSDNAKGAFIYVIVEDKDGSESQYLSEIPGYGHRTTSDGIINGWCNINIYNIEVPEGAKVRYGVTTDKAQTGRYCNAEYVSATDFVLKKQ